MGIKKIPFLQYLLKYLKSTDTEMHSLMGKDYRLMWQSEYRKGQSYVEFLLNTFQVCKDWQLENDQES